jgi:hypothetical protein
MTSLQQVMLDRFQRGLAAHIEEHFRVHWRVLGAQQMAEVIQFGVRRAQDLAYRTERDGYLFHSLMLYFGSHFDTDPQYPWLSKALADDAIGSRSQRLANAYDAAMDFLDSVAGPHGEHMAVALRRLQSTVLPELRREPKVNFEYLLSMLRATWPEKVERVGEQSLRELAESVMPVARSIGLKTPASAWLYVIACFFFGHGLERDPQFPWVGRPGPVGRGDGAARSFQDSFEMHLRALEA